MVKIKHHIITNIRKDLFVDVNTVGSRYITVGHLNIEQKQAEQSHSSDQTMSYLKTSHTSPLQVSHGVSFLGCLEKTGDEIWRERLYTV